MMRYYEVYLPDNDEPIITSNVRQYKELPEGTKVVLTITDRDGSLVEQDSLPVVNGRVKFSRYNKRTPKLWYG